MRREGGALSVLVVATCALAAPAAAESPPASAVQRPQPRVSAGLFWATSYWHLGPLGFTGTGGDFEIATRVGRRGQLVAETFLGRLSDTDTEVEGTHSRLGLTARWIPRAFHPDGSGAIELYVEGGVGMQRTWWDGGGQLTRSDVTFGSGMQVRVFVLNDLTFRAGVQFVWMEPLPIEELERTVCRGTCPDAGRPAPLDVAFLGQFGFAWGH